MSLELIGSNLTPPLVDSVFLDNIFSIQVLFFYLYKGKDTICDRMVINIKLESTALMIALL